MANTRGVSEQRLAVASQVGQLLRRRRKSLGLPQRELASKLGISQGRFSTLELDPSGLTLERLIALTNLLDLELVVRNRQRKTSRGEW
jgi:HTH-type transcriptional regulator/antitoxin HipB